MVTLNLSKDQLSAEQIHTSHLVVYPMPSDIRPPASQPSSPAPLCLLCAVVAENFLAISVFREIQLQTEYERRNKKRHFDLFLDVQSSLLSLALNISLTLANSPSPSRHRNMHLNEYSSSSMNEPPSHSQQHPTPNQLLPPPAIKPQPLAEPNPTQTEHLRALISPFLSSLLLLFFPQ